MIEHLETSEVRGLCKAKIEGLELWLRRLIDHVLTEKYGDYFEHQNENGDNLISNRILSPLDSRMVQNPGRYPRKIDAVLLDDAISIICNPNLYENFKPALRDAFPSGDKEARTFLERLIEPRNKLAHANPISLHEAERIFCYCKDITNSISNYYTVKNINQDYNVPQIIRFTDSFGNSMHREQLRVSPVGGVLHAFHMSHDADLRPGDVLTIEVEIDPAFEATGYSLSWKVMRGSNNPESTTNKLVLPIDVSHVCEQLTIYCKLRTKNEWHQLSNGQDDQLLLSYRVLPPI